MKKHNLAFIDVETTGLDPHRHEIIEIAGVLTDPKLKLLGEFEFKIKPDRLDVADQQSLRINGYTDAAWLFAPQAAQVLPEVGRKIAGAMMVGHNVFFDWQFVNQAFARAGLKNPLHYHRLDTMSMAYTKLYHDPKVEYFSLEYLCKHFGIKNERAHSALADVRATVELYKKLLGIA